jgi:hypothetical protein
LDVNWISQCVNGRVNLRAASAAAHSDAFVLALVLGIAFPFFAAPALLRPRRDRGRYAPEALLPATAQSAYRWFATLRIVPVNLSKLLRCARSTKSRSVSAVNPCAACLCLRLADLESTVAGVPIQHIYSTFLSIILLKTHSRKGSVVAL